MSYITEARSTGKNVLPPDINNSGVGFTIEGDDIRFGLSAIKGLGQAAIGHIIDARPFYDLEDLLDKIPKKGLNKGALKVLALSGALDSLYPTASNRMDLLQTAYLLRGFDDNLELELDSFNNKTMLDLEKQLLGVYVSGHPLDGIAVPVNWAQVPDDELVISSGILAEKREIVTKKGDPMAFIKVDFMEGQKELVLFPRQYESVRGTLKKDMVIKVECKFQTDHRRDSRSLIVEKLTVPKRINKHLFDKE